MEFESHYFEDLAKLERSETRVTRYEPKKIHVPKNGYLYRDGDLADRVLFITEGVYCTSKVSSDGLRQIITIGFPGDMQGTFSGNHHDCDCEAITPVSAEVYKRAEFDELVRIDPVFRERVMRLMASEIDNLRTHFTMLNKKHAIGRLAAFLCFFTERYGEEQSDGIRLSLPMAREDIADFLHLTAETVSRHFTYLKKEGTIVCMGPRALNIVRLARLRQLAE